MLYKVRESAPVNRKKLQGWISLLMGVLDPIQEFERNEMYH